jgi:hypothetical protein
MIDALSADELLSILYWGDQDQETKIDLAELLVPMLPQLTSDQLWDAYFWFDKDDHSRTNAEVEAEMDARGARGQLGTPP